MGAGRDIAGTYRPTAGLLRQPRWVLLMVGIAVVWQLVRAGWALANGFYGAAVWSLGFLLACAVGWWWAWTQRTVVSSDGIRVKRGRTWRTLTWAEIVSVPEPSRWSVTQMLSVTTTSGERVALHVPDSLWEPFAAYVDARLQPHPGEDGPRMRDIPQQDAE